MLLKKGMSWFLSSNGRKFVFAGVFFSGMGLMSFNYVPNTFLLNKYREFMQLYRHGLEVPVPANILKLFNQVTDEMKIPPREKEIIKPFIVYGFDVFHAGGIYFKQGAIIGIPIFYSCSTTDEIDISKIKILNKSVDWSSADGKQFLEALVLSESAKKYAIGREVAYVRKPYVFLNTLYPFSSLILVYSLSQSINKKFDLYQKPTSVRSVIYILASLFGYGMWALLRDMTNVHYEQLCDEEICSLGESYVQGGIEFYSKLLQRNIALRGLMGKTGEKLYSVNGNEQYFLRQKSLPLVYRKLSLEAHLKKQVTNESVV